MSVECVYCTNTGLLGGGPSDFCGCPIGEKKRTAWGEDDGPAVGDWDCELCRDTGVAPNGHGNGEEAGGWGDRCDCTKEVF